MDLSIPDLTSPATGGTCTVEVTDRAFERLAEIAEASGETQALRVAVLGGGCSGFSYEFALEGEAADTDMIIERHGHQVIIDAESLPFLAGSVIDFKEELIGARFAVENPNATSTCGCGTSFSI